MQEPLRALYDQLEAANQSLAMRYAWVPAHIEDLANFLELNDLGCTANQLRQARQTLLAELIELPVSPEE